MKKYKNVESEEGTSRCCFLWNKCDFAEFHWQAGYILFIQWIVPLSIAW